MKLLITLLLMLAVMATQSQSQVTPKPDAAPRASLTITSFKSSLGIYDIDAKITTEQVNALATTAVPSAQAALAAITNSADWATFDRTAADMIYRFWMETCAAAKAVVENTPYNPGSYHHIHNSYAKTYGCASSLFIFTKDLSYVDGWITNNVDRINNRLAYLPHESVKITDLVSAKRVLIYDLASVLSRPAGGPTMLVDTAKRLEIMERRAAGLTVIGKDALPKTAALTVAINTGNGLVEALRGFIGNDLPSLATAITKKRVSIQALKDQINSGMRDASPADVALIGSWLGVEPTAAWVKQYNGQ